jgi:nucleoside-diphosphate-sugar epimerase
VREPKSAARLARWPREVIIGDVCSRADMDRAMRGCDAVVHCAVGTGWPPDHVRRVTIEGTKTTAEAALAAGVKRFVHISTLFVHRRDAAGVLDESAPLDPGSDGYGQAKLAAERALEAVAKQGLSTIVLRPVRIYGPFSQTFTIRPLQAISEHRFAIRGDANVPANMVYVDNVVEAIAQALEAPDRLGGSAYLVSDAEQVSLREFYEYFAAAAGLDVRLVPASSNGAAAAAPGVASRWLKGFRTIATSPELRGIVRRVIETDPMGTLPRRLWNASPKLQQSLLRRFGADAAVIYRPSTGTSSGDLLYYGEPARVSIEKARTELGFAPPVPRERAMTLTLEWARSARLLPS